MSIVFKAEFLKLLRFIADKYLEMLPKGCIAAKTRLQIFVSELLSKDKIQPAEGSILQP